MVVHSFIGSIDLRRDSCQNESQRFQFSKRRFETEAYLSLVAKGAAVAYGSLNSRWVGFGHPAFKLSGRSSFLPRRHW